LNTSRWFKFDCGKEQASPCVLIVRLRGPIDRSHLRLFEEAVRWRDGAQRALDRRIELHVDANTRGGEVFAAMEIGRLLRRESAAFHVSRSAECSSACVFALMGATARSVAPGGRVGIHRPSLGTAGSEKLVESNRTPFDVPEGESEIVAGHMTEYSGFKYATFFMAEYLGMFAVSGLAVTLFLGGWHAPVRLLEFVPSYIWFFAKLSMLLFVYIWLRATLPRTRVDQMMNVAWKFMLPMAFTCVIAAAVWHYAGRGMRGWLWSLFVIVFVYSALSILLDTRRKFARRVYRFAE